MKQTAVKWLIDQLEKKGDASVNMSIGRMQISIIEEDYINLLEQAKEMEREEIVKAYTDTLPFTPENIAKCEQYYNVNFEPLEK